MRETIMDFEQNSLSPNHTVYGYQYNSKNGNQPTKLLRNIRCVVLVPRAYFAEQINLRGIFFLFFSLLVNNPPCLDIVYKTVGQKCIATIGLDNRDFGVLNYYYCFFFYTVPV